MISRIRAYLRSWFRARAQVAVDPHEVLLDAHNLPNFDTSQLEGKLESPIRTGTLSSIVVVFGLIVIVFSGRLFYLQVVEGSTFKEQSDMNRLAHSPVFADRGVIYDRNGVELAWNEPTPGEPYATRMYTTQAGLAHVLGYVALPRRDSKGFFHRTAVEGVSGVEKLFNDTLTGENGLKIIETNAVGNVQSESAIIEPHDGEAVTLAIDTRVQSALHRYIKERSEAGTFEGGSGVIMDIHTGEIVALTNYPEFSPSILTNGTNTQAIADYQTDERKVFLNRAVGGLYTPGSIIKPYMALAALHEEIISPYTQIFSSGQLVVPNPYNPSQPTIFKDWRAHGNVDMRRAVAVSSNVYFFHIGGGFGDQEGLGISRIEKYSRLFGFGEYPMSEFEEEAKGVIPNPDWKRETFGEDIWRVGDTYNTSIGQYGFQVSPLQAVRAVAAIANRGSLLDPSIIKGGTGEITRLPFSDADYDVAHDGMRDAVLIGTTQALNFPWLEIAGKTGTAEVGRDKSLMNSWVMGFWPYQDPQYAFAVAMEEAPAGTLQGAPYVMFQFFSWLRDEAPEYLGSISE